jgi:DNA-binding response OmpR family regulator
LAASVVLLTDPALRGRLSAPRPDLVLIRAVTTDEEDAALHLLGAELEALRALAVPVIAACGSSALPPRPLQLLADDVLLPPHSATEALLRATIVARRRGGSGRPVATAGPLTVDLEGYRVWLSGHPVSLTYTEFQLLRLLLLNRGKVLTRQALLNKIWGYDYLGGLRTVDVHIRRLRAKIESEAPDLIETVRHVGYRIAE